MPFTPSVLSAVCYSFLCFRPTSLLFPERQKRPPRRAAQREKGRRERQVFVISCLHSVHICHIRHKKVPRKRVRGTCVRERDLRRLRSFDSLRVLRAAARSSLKTVHWTVFRALRTSRCQPYGFPLLWRAHSLHRVILSEVEGSIMRQYTVCPTEGNQACLVISSAVERSPSEQVPYPPTVGSQVGCHPERSEGSDTKEIPAVAPYVICYPKQALDRSSSTHFVRSE